MLQNATNVAKGTSFHLEGRNEDGLALAEPNPGLSLKMERKTNGVLRTLLYAYNATKVVKDTSFHPEEPALSLSK